MENLRILVVDDESGIRSGICKALQKYTVSLPEFDTEMGFDLAQAADGASALAALEDQAYDMLLLDYKLPDMTGLDILTRIKELEVDITTIMVTAFASLEVAVSTTKNGAFDFLAKPFTPDELKAVIKKAASSVLTHRYAKKLEEERHKVRFQFINVLVHELKAPLGMVESYLYLLRDRILGDEVEPYDKYVNRTIERTAGMRKLILDILDLTRLESGQKNRDLQSVDVVEQARDSIEIVTPEASERGIEINLNAPDKLAMLADSGELSIIFNNLLTNAVKYNRDSGRVDIYVIRADNQVKITVSDTGIGMTEEEQGRLFKEFSRIKNEKTRTILGSGLGLSILKNLAGMYDGSVAVSSVPDEGTTFTVVLRDGKPETRS